MWTFASGTAASSPQSVVEGVAVQPPGAGFQPAWVDEVRSADLRDVYLKARVLANERARGPCVVEVDVREEQVPDVGELEATLGKPRLQRRFARRRPAVEERRPLLCLDDVDPDDLLSTEVEQVDRLGRHMMILGGLRTPFARAPNQHGECQHGRRNACDHPDQAGRVRP